MGTITTLQALAALATALGLGSVIPVLAKGLIAHWTGSAERERKRIQLAEHDRAKADERASDAVAKVHEWREYSSHLRSLLIERCGMPPAELPPRPDQVRPEGLHPPADAPDDGQPVDPT